MTVTRIGAESLGADDLNRFPRVHFFAEETRHDHFGAKKETDFFLSRPVLSEHAPTDELVREVHLSMTGLILDDEGRIRVQNAVGDHSLVHPLFDLRDVEAFAVGNSSESHHAARHFFDDFHEILEQKTELPATQRLRVLHQVSNIEEVEVFLLGRVFREHSKEGTRHQTCALFLTESDGSIAYAGVGILQIDVPYRRCAQERNALGEKFRRLFDEFEHFSGRFDDASSFV